MAPRLMIPALGAPAGGEAGLHSGHIGWPSPKGRAGGRSRRPAAHRPHCWCGQPHAYHPATTGGGTTPQDLGPQRVRTKPSRRVRGVESGLILGAEPARPSVPMRWSLTTDRRSSRPARRVSADFALPAFKRRPRSRPGDGSARPRAKALGLGASGHEPIVGPLIRPHLSGRSFRDWPACRPDSSLRRPGSRSATAGASSRAASGRTPCGGRRFEQSQISRR